MKADKIKQNMVLVVKYCEHEKIQNPKSMDFGHHKDALLVSLRPVHPSRPATIFPEFIYIQAYMPYGSSEVSSNQPDGTKGYNRCPLDPLGPCRPTP